MTGLAGGFLGWLATTTLSATLLAGVLGALKATLGPRMPLALHHGLWLILVVRLLLPTLPEVPLGLPTPGLPGPSLVLPPGPETSVVVSTAVRLFPIDPPAVTASGWALDPATGLVVLWATGFFWTLGRRVGADLGLRSRLNRSSEPPPEWVEGVYRVCRTDLGVKAPVPLVVTRAVRVPALIGWFRPRILLPQNLLGSLTPQDLGHILSHELTHWRRHDILWGWVTGVLRCVHWFNPALWLAFRQMDQDAERACDAAVLTRAGGPDRRAYGETLVRLSALLSPVVSAPWSTAGWAAPHRALATRLGLIVTPPPRSPWGRVLSLALVFLVAAGGLTTAQAPVPAPLPPQGSGLKITVEDRRSPGTPYLLTPVEYLKTSLYGLVSGGGRSLEVNGTALGPGVMENLPATGPWVLTASGDPGELLESLELVHEKPLTDAGLKVTRTALDQGADRGPPGDPARWLPLMSPSRTREAPPPLSGPR